MSRFTQIAAVSILLLAGCGLLKEKVVTKVEYVVRPPIILPEPEPVNQLPLEWHVITAKNLEQKIKELRDSSGEFVVFALTPEGYKSLSLNASELRRFIQAQQAYIKVLKEYYERPASKP